MKIIVKTFIFSLLFISFSCNNSESNYVPEQENFDLDFSNIGLGLKIDFSKTIFSKAEQNIDVLASEMVDYIYNNKEYGLDEFKIKSYKENLFINYSEEEMMSKGFIKDTGDNNEILVSYKTEKINCNTESSVKDAIVQILGNGDRNIDIKFIRNTSTVIIEYTYRNS